MDDAAGKFYRANLEHDNINFCQNNTLVKDGQVYQLNTSSQILADNYLFDFKLNKVYNLASEHVVKIVGKKIKLNLDDPMTSDGFTRSLGLIKKMSIKGKGRNEKIITIDSSAYQQPIIIKLDQYGQIIAYENKEITAIDNAFLMHNDALKEINIPQVHQIGSSFLMKNTHLTNLDIDKVTQVGDCFLTRNRILEKIKTTNLQTVGDVFLSQNLKLKSFRAPLLTKVGNSFLSDNCLIKDLDIANIAHIGDHFMMFNNAISDLNFPKITNIKECFFPFNEKIKKIDMPNVVTIGGSFLCAAKLVDQVNLPNVTSIGDYFLNNNTNLTTLNLPKVESVGEHFLSGNKNLACISMPKLTTIGDNFLYENLSLTPQNVYIPHIRKVKNTLFFIYNNEQRKEILKKLLKQHKAYDTESHYNKLGYDYFYDRDRKIPFSDKLRYFKQKYLKLITHER